MVDVTPSLRRTMYIGVSLMFASYEIYLHFYWRFYWCYFYKISLNSILYVLRDDVEWMLKYAWIMRRDIGIESSLWIYIKCILVWKHLTAISIHSIPLIIIPCVTEKTSYGLGCTTIDRETIEINRFSIYKINTASNMKGAWNISYSGRL